jgi:hypothetical protein
MINDLIQATINKKAKKKMKNWNVLKTLKMRRKLENQREKKN